QAWPKNNSPTTRRISSRLLLTLIGLTLCRSSISSSRLASPVGRGGLSTTCVMLLLRSWGSGGDERRTGRPALHTKRTSRAPPEVRLPRGASHTRPTARRLEGSLGGVSAVIPCCLLAALLPHGEHGVHPGMDAALVQ